MNIVLTGFMGTGKSEVARALGERLRWQVLDTDDMIEKEAGASVAAIFEKAGEAAFRDMEARTVELVAFLDRTVIATGGGVPLRESNMAQLKKRGRVFLLTARPETIFKRLDLGSGARPLLSGGDALSRIRELLEARREAYSRADEVIATDDLTVEGVAERVLKKLPAGVWK